MTFNKSFELELVLFKNHAAKFRKNIIQQYCIVAVVLIKPQFTRNQTRICNLQSHYFTVDKNPARIFKHVCPSSRNHITIYLCSSKYFCEDFDYLRVFILKWSMYIRWGTAKVMFVISVQHFSQGEFSVCSIFKIQSLRQLYLYLC